MFARKDLLRNSEQWDRDIATLVESDHHVLAVDTRHRPALSLTIRALRPSPSFNVPSFRMFLRIEARRRHIECGHKKIAMTTPDREFLPYSRLQIALVDRCDRTYWMI